MRTLLSWWHPGAAATRTRVPFQRPRFFDVSITSHSTAPASPSRYGKRYEADVYGRGGESRHGNPPIGGYTWLMDLFDQSGADNLAGRAPLAERLRPATLYEVVGQPHLTDDGGPLRSVVDRGRIGSVVLWGP